MVKNSTPWTAVNRDEYLILATPPLPAELPKQVKRKDDTRTREEC